MRITYPKHRPIEYETIFEQKRKNDRVISLKSFALDIEVFVDARIDLKLFPILRLEALPSIRTLSTISGRELAASMVSSYYFQPVLSIFTVLPRLHVYTCVSSARLWPTTSVIASAMIARRTFPLADLRECQNVRAHKRASARLSILAWHSQASIIGRLDDRYWFSAYKPSYVLRNE